MFLRVQDGRYAGEIREFPPDVGLVLLRQGRAVNPFLLKEDTPEERAAEKPQPPAAKPERKRR